MTWLRRNIAIVNQEPVIFTGTVFDNICYGSMFATEEQVRDAAIKANCHDFIMELPDKYQTRIGPKETLLSGGQKQRFFFLPSRCQSCCPCYLYPTHAAVTD